MALSLWALLLASAYTCSAVSFPRAISSESIQLTYESDYWIMENVTVGAATNLRMLLDTGSSQVLVFHGRNQSSAEGVYLNETFGAGFSTATPNEQGRYQFEVAAYKDTVAVGNISVPNVTYFVETSTIMITPQVTNYDGVFGFAGLTFSAIEGARPIPWMRYYCNESSTVDCRFGLATGFNGAGALELGGLDQTLFTGSLEEVAVVDDEWITLADIMVDNEAFHTETEPQSAKVDWDYGTPGILGPIEVVRAIFEKWGLRIESQTVTYPNPKLEGGPATYLTGHFNCSTPPTFGLGLPSKSISKTQTVFNVQASAMIFKEDGNGNCTATLQGLDAFANSSTWIFGQSFYQGLYVDHNLLANTMGFAKLNNPNVTNSSPTPSSTPTSTSGGVSSPTSSSSSSQFGLSKGVASIAFASFLGLMLG